MSVPPSNSSTSYNSAKFSDPVLQESARAAESIVHRCTELTKSGGYFDRMTQATEELLQHSKELNSDK